MDIHLICDAEIPQEVLLLMPNPPACQHSISQPMSSDCSHHHVDHCKGANFSKPAKQAHDNVPCELYKMFTDCCPQCNRLLQGRKPVAGIKNIVTSIMDLKISHPSHLSPSVRRAWPWHFFGSKCCKNNSD